MRGKPETLKVFCYKPQKFKTVPGKALVPVGVGFMSEENTVDIYEQVFHAFIVSDN
jgi:hypothetical protein